MSGVTKPRIGILGAGRMGSGLATLLTEAGHEVVLSRRDPHGAAGRSEGVPEGVAVTSFREAARFGDVLILAVPHRGIEPLAAAVADLVVGKVVVDVTNSVVYEDGRTRSGLVGTSNGTWVAARFPRSRVTRAYNHIQDEMLVSRAHRQPGNWAVAVAGDDDDAVRTTSELVWATCYVPVEVGTLEQSVVLDPGGPIFPHMMTPADLRDLVDSAQGSGRRG